MNKRLWLWIALGGAMILFAALLSACGQDTSAPEFEVTTDALNETGDEADVAEPVVEEAGEAAMTVAFTDQTCLDCHTNQDILKALAVEEESGESLSSGPG